MERNRSLDILKAICSFMVVCIHATPSGLLGTIAVTLSRVAVPIFFMITGYYYTHTKERNNEKKQLLKLLRLFVGANLLFFIWSFLCNWIVNKTIIPLLSEQFSVKSILSFVFFNTSPFRGHLWYLGAILYVLLIIFCFDKKWRRQMLYPLVPVLLLANLFLGEGSSVIFGQSFPAHWSRNFLFIGLPYFLLGDLIYTCNIKIKGKTAWILTLVFASIMLLEHFLMDAFFNTGLQDHYFNTTFLAFSVFLLTTQSNINCNKKHNRVLAFIGARLSTNIYIMHPIIIAIFMEVLNFLSQTILWILVHIYWHISPLLVFICTVFVTWGLHRISVAVKSKVHCPK